MMIGAMGLNLLADATNSSASLWAFILMLMLAIAYTMMRPIFRRKDPLDKPPAYARLSQQRSAEKQMQNVLVELSDMARQISAQLDTRAAKLEALIKEADEKLAALKLAARGEPGAAAPGAPGRANEERLVPEPANVVDAAHALVYALADQGRSAREIAQELNRPSGEIELILALRH
jgi:hypothetical protein